MNRKRMANRAATNKAPPRTNQSFAEVLSHDRELSALRAEYALKPAAKRRMAAQWAYDDSIANRLFGAALARLQREPAPAPERPPGFAALAIDPEAGGWRNWADSTRHRKPWRKRSNFPLRVTYCRSTIWNVSGNCGKRRKRSRGRPMIQ